MVQVTVATVPPLYLRIEKVLELVPISKSEVWRKVRAGSFPAPHKLSPRVTAWLYEDVVAWAKSNKPARIDDLDLL